MAAAQEITRGVQTLTLSTEPADLVLGDVNSDYYLILHANGTRTSSFEDHGERHITRHYPGSRHTSAIFRKWDFYMCFRFIDSDKMSTEQRQAILDTEVDSAFHMKSDYEENSIHVFGVQHVEDIGPKTYGEIMELIGSSNPVFRFQHKEKSIPKLPDQVFLALEYNSTTHQLTWSWQR